MLPLLANQVVEAFNVEGYHIRVLSYPQFSLPIQEHVFAIFPDRRTLQLRSRWFNLRRYLWLIISFIRLLISIKKTIVYCTDDSCIKVLLLILRILPKKDNIKVVYHEFENVDYNNKLFVPGNYFNLKDFRKIDLTIAPEKNRLALLLHNLGMSPQQGMVIPNTCFVSMIKDPVRHKVFDGIMPGSKIICHIGAIGDRGHFFIEFLEAMPTNFTLLLVGTLQSEIKAIVDLYAPKKKIVLSGQVSHEELKTIYPFIDFGLILYKGIDYNFEYCAPNKLYEFWSFGVPVIAHELGGLKDIFENPFQGKLFDFLADDFNCQLNYWLSNERSSSNKSLLTSMFREKCQLSIYSSRLIDCLNELIPES